MYEKPDKEDMDFFNRNCELFREQLTGTNNLFFLDKKYPFKCTGPYPSAVVDERWQKTIPTMQAELTKRLNDEFNKLIKKSGVDKHYIAQLWGLSPNSDSEVNRALEHPEKCQLDRCVQLCATIGVNPNWIRSGDDGGRLKESKFGTHEWYDMDDLQKDYAQLNDANKEVLTKTLKALLQSQKATERAMLYTFTCWQSVSSWEDNSENREELWREIDRASYLAGIADEIPSRDPIP